MERIDGWQLNSGHVRSMNAEQQISVVCVLTDVQHAELIVASSLDTELSPRSPDFRHCRHQPARLASWSDDNRYEPAYSGRPRRVHRLGHGDPNMGARRGEFSSELH